MSLVCVSLGLGMATQETVTRFLIVGDPTEDVSLEALNVWGTAETYYHSSKLSWPLLGVTNPSTSAESIALNTVDSMEVASRDVVPHESEREGTDCQSVEGDAVGAHAEAQLHPRELVQTEFSPPTPTARTPSKAVPEREPNVVHFLPPPSRRAASRDLDDRGGLSNRSKRAGFSRTPFDVKPPASQRTVSAVHPVVPSYEPTRYANGAEAVRRRAEIRAEERRRRIEARKWLGYSPLRPPVGATPFTGGDSTRPLVITVPIVVNARD
jgi:hypothetical protein